MTVVSVRVPEETLKTLADAGVNPSEIAKEALEREARRIRVHQNLDRLHKIRVKGKRPTLDILREIRDDE